MSSSSIYLITGANRGIGLALVKRVANTHADAFIYAGVRRPGESAALKELEALYSGRISVIKLISGDAESNAALAKEIEARHGRLDTVIANAAFANTIGPVLKTSAHIFEEHFAVNVLGPVVLFQSVHDLLKASSTPCFCAITSTGASLDGPYMRSTTLGNSAYGASKAALNYVTRKIHFENEWLTAFPLAPGVVNTDMLADAIVISNSPDFKAAVDAVAISADEAAVGLLNVIDQSSRAEHGGEFMNHDGTKMPW